MSNITDWEYTAGTLIGLGAALQAIGQATDENTCPPPGLYCFLARAGVQIREGAAQLAAEIEGGRR